MIVVAWSQIQTSEVCAKGRTWCSVDWATTSHLCCWLTHWGRAFIWTSTYETSSIRVLWFRRQQYIRTTITSSGVTRGCGGGRTAPGDTLQGVTPEGKKFCGQIYKEQWRNEVGQVKKLTPHPGEGDTRMKAIKSDSDSDSDEQKRSPGFFRKK